MSKIDSMRALREARYAERMARAGAPVPARVAPRRPDPAPSEETGEPVAESAEGARCGHRSINGRGCTREQGHPEKSHRYS